MRAKLRCCSHDEADLEIVCVVPASPGWGVACLVDSCGEDVELTIHAVAAWAHVRLGSLSCECPAECVLPMTAGFGRLVVEMPHEPSEHSETRIVEPGMTAVAPRHDDTGRRHLVVIAGAWAAGVQRI